MKAFLEFIRAPEFVRCREEVERENRMAIRMLALAGLPLSVANIFAQTFFSRRELFSLRGCWLLLYFLCLFLLERFLLPKRFAHCTALIYLVEAPVMVASILLGTVWDPTHQALTFLMFLMAVPVFIIDRPLRVLSVSAAWSTVFLSVCLLVKDPSTHRGDFFHVLEFFLASSTVTIVTLRVRLEALRRLERTTYHLEHDPLTGARNRRCLEGRVSGYLGRPMVLLLGDVDQLTMYNDFYGHEVGDQILGAFSQRLAGAFGEENSYRYGGDEMLCVAPEVTEAQCLERIAHCRAGLCRNTYEGHTIALTCAFGYVTGTPTTPKQFQEMIQLADIYAHQARSRGQDQTVGGPYDAVHLRAGIVESNLYTHTRAYETNPLTGLPSLSYFTSRSEDLLTHVAELPRTPVVGFFNLIHFRDFNQEYGYAQGDALLRHTAKLLQEYFQGRHLCHIAGSQFGFLCYLDEVEPGLTLVNQALSVYRPGVVLQSKTGIVEYKPGDSMLDLLDKAKAAHDSIYGEKDSLFCRYDEGLDAENHFRQYILNHVDEAVEAGWLKVYYQPIVRSITGEICNEEALSRWDDPRFGFLSPFQFIPTLEENRLIYKVSLHIVRQVLRDFEHKRAVGIPLVPVSVNLSRHDFEQCDMVREITDLVDASGFPRSLLCIEITESSFVENQQMLMHAVDRFRQNGFQVWMDDFGSEYSTLNMLQELNFDLIKIDMEFMKNFSASGKNMIIVSDLIDMAKRMGITTLIEGIETEEQYRFLRELGCEKLQGYLFNKPNDLDYIIQRFRSHTGLQYESAEETAYYEDIGRVNLNTPLAYGGADSETRRPDEQPSGILEYQGGHFSCVRGNQRFFQLLQSSGLLPVSRMGTQRQSLTEPPPQPLTDAAERCLRGGDWVPVRVDTISGAPLEMRLKRVSENGSTGGVALLSLLHSA